jgi:hypothetical protein
LEAGVPLRPPIRISVGRPDVPSPFAQGRAE